MTGEGLTAAEVEAIVCDCPVALLAMNACPVHADDQIICGYRETRTDGHYEVI